MEAGATICRLTGRRRDRIRPYRFDRNEVNVYVDPSFRGSCDGGVRYGADAGYFFFPTDADSAGASSGGSAEFDGTGRGYATRGFVDADYSFRN